MHFIFELLLDAGVLLIVAYLLPSVYVKNYGTAIAVSLVIGVLNATIGFLLRLPINVVTLGLLSFFVRLIVMAIIIKIVDSLFKGFEVKNFAAAVLLASILAVVGTLATNIF
ncbi:MAG: phage holin family protein [Chitinophagales bacterium]|nr:phage holin family protein [Chitinophagales bacterium]